MESQTIGRSQNARHVPGLSGLAALRRVPQWRRDPVSFFLSLSERYGDIARFQLGPVRMIVLRHPERIAHVLQRNHRRYEKSGRGYAAMREVFGNGLLTSEGDYWKKQRRVVQPAFQRKNVESFAKAIDDEALAMIERWRGQGQLNAYDEMTEATMRIVVKTLFGMELEADFGRLSSAFAGLTLSLRDQIVHLRLPEPVPTPRNLRKRGHVKVIREIVSRLIELRRRECGDDLLSMLIAATDPETGQGMTDAQLEDEVLTLFLAGHDTTANTLSWALYLLSRHPDVRRTMTEEVDRVVGDGPLTLETVGELRYTKALLCEVLRLYPPAWLIPRRAREDDHIGGYEIRAGDNIVAMPLVAHRHPRFWPNPEGFEPNRFIDGPPSGDSRLAYFPFGAGPRLCVGKALAELEAMIVIARMAQHCRLDLIPGQRISPMPAITLKPSTPLAMRVAWR